MDAEIVFGKRLGARKLAVVFFSIWAFTLLCRPQDYLAFLVPLRPALSLGLFTLLLSLPVKNFDGPVQNAQIHLYSALLVVLFFSSLFSIYPGASITDFFHYAFTACFVFVFTKLVTTEKELTDILRICCIGIGIYCLCILTQGESINDRIMFGSMFDANDIAYYVLSFLPFNLVIFTSGPVMKMLCIGNLLLGLVTILKTGSRGGLLGLLSLLLWLFGRRTKALNLGVPGRVFVLVAALVSFQLAPINVERFRSITDMESDYNATDEQGRVALWKVGLRMMAENPLTGVGFNRFPEGVGRDRRQRESDQARWQAAHNSLIQIGAESGIFGLGLFTILTFNAFRIFRRSTRSSSPQVAKLGEMAESGFLGQFVAAMFLSQAYSAYWTFYIALSAVLFRLVADGNRAELNPAPSPSGLGNG